MDQMLRMRGQWFQDGFEAHGGPLLIELSDAGLPCDAIQTMAPDHDREIRIDAAGYLCSAWARVTFYPAAGEIERAEKRGITFRAI